jgi:ligand-binding sensor domain-containing protein
MKLDERILQELQTEQAEVPPRAGSIDSVIARGTRRKAIANGVVAVMAAAVAVAVVGVTAWLSGPGSGNTDVAGQPETWITYTEADGLSGSCACDLAVAADGTLWAVGASGVFRFDGSAWVAESPPPASSLFAYGAVAAAAPDGSMWFVGVEAGAAHWEDGSWTVIEPFDIDVVGGFLDVAVTSDGTVWASEGDQLTRLVGDSFEQVDEDFQLIADHESSEDRPSLGMSMAVAADGTLWVAGGPSSVAGGPGRLYHVVGNEVTVVTEVTAVNTQGPGTLLGVAPDGAVWLSGDFYGTTDGDLSFLLRFDEQRWTSFPIGEVAGEEALWRSQYVEPGAYRFDGATWTHFGVNDGLAGVDLESVITMADGSIWFGTASNGVTRYQPGSNPQSGTHIDDLGIGTPFLEDDWPDDWATTTAPPINQAP